MFIDDGCVVLYLVREFKGGWDGIFKGLDMFCGVKVSGEKLVVRIL